MSPETARRIFAAFRREPYLHSLHLAGGEAMLRVDLLLEIVRLATSMDLPLDYLETNASWCVDRQVTRERLVALRDAGLPGILVSVSMFHNEFVPFARTRACVEVGHEVFGRGGVTVWLPHLYEMLERMPEDDHTHTIHEFCARFGIPEWDPSLPALYHVIPCGRAPEALRRCYALRPAESFLGETCGREILSTEHFHIDLYGNLFTGLCAGLAPADLERLHPRIVPETFPVTSALIEGGPSALAALATDRHGFRPRPDGYASKCDLCQDVRGHLARAGEYPELRPADHYA
jgi:hypothetical protein